ncbi:MAG: LysR family transcriptional regulator [Alphaproteobacteria bacterium]|nr:LysR family transcriptional regulator [Alphaproteobacteria bacterium]
MTDTPQDRALTWDDLELLNAILETGTATAAAQRLGVGQPKVSRNLERLERELSLKLFERQPRGLAPTPDMDELRRDLSTMRAVGDRVRARLLRIQPSLSQEPLKVSVTDGFGNYWLAARTDDILARCGGVKVEIEAREGPVDLQRLQALPGLAVGFERPNDIDISSVLMGMVSFRILASRRFAEEHGMPSTWEEVPRFPLVAQTTRIGDAYTRWNEAVRRAQDVRIRAGLTKPLVDYIKAGAGIGFFPRYLPKWEPDLVSVELPDTPMGEVFLIWARQFDALPNLRAFRNALIEVFQEDIRRPD